jgi:hypothetical protein
MLDALLVPDLEKENSLAMMAGFGFLVGWHGSRMVLSISSLAARSPLDKLGRATGTGKRNGFIAGATAGYPLVNNIAIG